MKQNKNVNALLVFSHLIAIASVLRYIVWPSVCWVTYHKYISMENNLYGKASVQTLEYTKRIKFVLKSWMISCKVGSSRCFPTSQQTVNFPDWDFVLKICKLREINANLFVQINTEIFSYICFLTCGCLTLYREWTCFVQFMDFQQNVE